MYHLRSFYNNVAFLLKLKAKGVGVLLGEEGSEGQKECAYERTNFEFHFEGKAGLDFDTKVSGKSFDDRKALPLII